MSCVLRIAGKNLDVDKLTKKLPIKVYHIYKKGDPYFKSKPKGRKQTMSGINFLTSNADFDKLDRQIKGTIKFLEKHRLLLKKITTNENVEFCTLDFGINLRMGYNNIASQSDYFPHKLLKLAGDLQIDIGISLYPLDLEEQMEKRLSKK